MPKFNGQNKKRIDPRYFSEELLEEESAPPTPIDREIVRTSAEESPALAQRNKKMKARCAKYGKVFDAGKNKCVEDDPVDRTLDQLGVEPLEETGTRKEEIQRALKEQDDLLAMLDAQGVEAATDEEAAMYEKCVASGIKGTDCHRIAARERAARQEHRPTAVGGDIGAGAAGELAAQAAAARPREMSKREAVRFYRREIAKRAMRFGLFGAALRDFQDRVKALIVRKGVAPSTLKIPGGGKMKFPKIKLV